MILWLKILLTVIISSILYLGSVPQLCMFYTSYKYEWKIVYFIAIIVPIISAIFVGIIYGFIRLFVMIWK